MKKRFLLYFLIACFLWIPNVFASEYSFGVCSNDCDFNDLDSALTAAEEYTDEDEVYLNVTEEASYTISSHDIAAYVSIYTYGNLVIDGEGSTINTIKGLYLESDDSSVYNVEFKNINIITEHCTWLLDIEDFNQVNLTNVYLEITDPQNVQNLSYGLYLYRQNSFLDNVTIVGFVFGVYPDEDNTKIQNSNLDGCVFSLYLYNSTVKVENTPLSYVYHYTNSNVKLDVGDKIVVYNDAANYYDNGAWYDFIRETGELYLTGDYQTYLRIYNPTNSSSFIAGSLSKSFTMNASSMNIFDTLFDDDDYEMEDYDIEILNDDVVSVEDGVIKPLKSGKAVILLTDKNTGIEYRLNVSVDLPTITNPMTGNTFWFDFILVVIIFAVLGGYAYKKQHN